MCKKNKLFGSGTLNLSLREQFLASECAKDGEKADSGDGRLSFAFGVGCQASSSFDIHFHSYVNLKFIFTKSVVVLFVHSNVFAFQLNQHSTLGHHTHSVIIF